MNGVEQSQMNALRRQLKDSQDEVKRLNKRLDPIETRKMILEQPIKNIVDGWTLENGDLYVFVECPDGVNYAITLNKKK